MQASKFKTRSNASNAENNAEKRLARQREQAREVARTAQVAILKSLRRRTEGQAGQQPTSRNNGADTPAAVKTQKAEPTSAQGGNAKFGSAGSGSKVLRGLAPTASGDAPVASNRIAESPGQAQTREGFGSRLGLIERLRGGENGARLEAWVNELAERQEELQNLADAAGSTEPLSGRAALPGVHDQTGPVDADTLITGLEEAGYGSEPTGGLSDAEKHEVTWLVETYSGDGSFDSWQEVHMLGGAGLLNLDDPGAPLVDMPAAVMLALRGFDDSLVQAEGEGPVFWDGMFLGDGGDWVDFGAQPFNDDLAFSLALEGPLNNIIIDPTQLGLIRNAVPVDENGEQWLTAEQLSVLVGAGMMEFNVDANGDMRMRLADPDATLLTALEVAPELADGAPLNESELRAFVNQLTGSQFTPGNIDTHAEWLIEHYGNDGQIQLDGLRQAVLDGKLTTNVDINDVITIEVTPTEGVGLGEAVVGTAQAFAVLISTPPQKIGPISIAPVILMPDGVTTLRDMAQLGEGLRNGQWLGEGEVYIGKTVFKATDRGDGTGTIEMQMPGGAWVTVFEGDSNSAVKGQRTYEFDAGITGSASVNEDGDLAGDVGSYIRLKVFETFWVHETDPNGGNQSFRARLYAPPVVSSSASFVEPGDTTSSAVPRFYDLRWGSIDGTFSPPSGNTAANPAALIEFGISFTGSVNLEGAVDSFREGNIAGGVSSLRGNVSLTAYRFGLFEFQAATGSSVDDNRAPAANRLMGSFFRVLGDRFQHTGLVVSATLSAGASADSRDATAEQQTRQLDQNLLLNGIATLTNFGDLTSFVGGLADQFGDPVEKFLGDVGDMVNQLAETGILDITQDAISATMLTKEVASLLSGRGLGNFDSLPAETRTALVDAVIQRTLERVIQNFEASMLAEAGADPNGASPNATSDMTQGDPALSLLKDPDETIAQYTARVSGLLLKELPGAIGDVLTSADVWDAVADTAGEALEKALEEALKKIAQTAVTSTATAVATAAAGYVAAAAADQAASTGQAPGVDGVSLTQEQRDALAAAQVVLEAADVQLGLYESGAGVDPEETIELLDSIDRVRADLEASGVASTPLGQIVISQLNETESRLEATLDNSEEENTDFPTEIDDGGGEEYEPPENQPVDSGDGGEQDTDLPVEIGGGDEEDFQPPEMYPVKPRSLEVA